MPNDHAALSARFASQAHEATSRKLYADNSLRKIVLGAGGWRLYGHATQIYYVTRNATDNAGTLASGQSAPVSLAGPTAGTAPTVGDAWSSGYSPLAALALPTDPTQWIEIAVPLGEFRVLYVGVASGNAAPVLEGPFQ